MAASKEDRMVYEGLFEHVKNEHEKNNQILNCDKEGFLCQIGTAPKKISFEEMKDLEGEAFLSCAFMAFFQRLPVKEEIERCNNLSKEEILKYLSNKASFSIRGIELTDCPYNIKPGLKGKIVGKRQLLHHLPRLERLPRKCLREFKIKSGGLSDEKNIS